MAATTLDLIHDALEAIDPNHVYYGTAAALPNGEPWNYTVFSRDKTSVTSTGFSDLFIVAVIRENYVPEGMDATVIDAIEAIPGLRFAGEAIEYVYDVKPNSTRTVEMMKLVFHKARKRS